MNRWARIAACVGCVVLASCQADGVPKPAGSPLPTGAGGTVAATSPAKVAMPAVTAEISNTDACATQMHDLCGALLLYYAANHELPASLARLRAAPGADTPLETRCPLLRKEYLYARAGNLSRSPSGRVIVADPTSAHGGRRWGIAIQEPTAGEPLLARVVLLKE